MKPISWKQGSLFSVYKPVGPTSFDVIAKLRKLTGVRKIGHAGTLDPLASGVLVVGIGREATKKLANACRFEKEYLATVKLGETSSTDDAEGEKTKMPVLIPPQEKTVKETLHAFVGCISQIPPAYSAIKIKGEPAYKLARTGALLFLQPRNVYIKKIIFLSYRYPLLRFKAITGAGVYIRSLARDIGERLGTGGSLLKLERARIGPYHAKKALRVMDL